MFYARISKDFKGFQRISKDFKGFQKNAKMQNISLKLSLLML